MTCDLLGGEVTRLDELEFQLLLALKSVDRVPMYCLEGGRLRAVCRLVERFQANPESGSSISVDVLIDGQEERCTGTLKYVGAIQKSSGTWFEVLVSYLSKQDFF